MKVVARVFFLVVVSSLVVWACKNRSSDNHALFSIISPEAIAETKLQGQWRCHINHLTLKGREFADADMVKMCTPGTVSLTTLVESDGPKILRCCFVEGAPSDTCDINGADAWGASRQCDHARPRPIQPVRPN